MKFGILLAPMSWGPAVDLAGLEDAAEHAASIGWSVHVPEHRRRIDYVPSALLLAAMLGARLPGVDIATAGVIAGRQPAQTLHDGAAVAHRYVSALGGSFRLGVVAGYDPADFPPGTYEDRFRLLDEFLALLPDGGPLSVMVGGSSGPALERAARAGAWLAPTTLTAEGVASRIATLRDLSPLAGVTVIRRLQGRSLPFHSDGRTPQETRWTPATARKSAAELAALGVDEIVVGPVHSVAAVQEAHDDLTEI